MKITPEMIGLFFEDINFAADGGLYAEMIENRSFEAKEGFGTPGNFYSVDDNGYAWSHMQQTYRISRVCSILWEHLFQRPIHTI
ncbi:MAG: hypothetical protein ACLRI8_11605 [Agathobacter rectalis]